MHAQFVSKAHHVETKFEQGASDRNSCPVQHVGDTHIDMPSNKHALQ